MTKPKAETREAKPPAAVAIPTEWPNGSGVFSALEKGIERVELGRVVREGARWRVWQRIADGYRDKGLVESQVVGVGALELPTVTSRGAVGAARSGRHNS